MKNILVLCTGNSCRSQMAEGFLRKNGYNVQSAGVESHGLNPLAVKVMNEIGIDISNQKSKKINSLDLKMFDVLFTVCHDANESCPIIPTIQKRVHKSFIDPAKVKGNEMDKLQIFREVRDKINYFCDKEFKKLDG
ncbi:MAG: arsenate reductase ArsC [Bacteroidota bacterium]|nr:arsenate reductase ArsC [Bacteroidota bacterium]